MTQQINLYQSPICKETQHFSVKGIVVSNIVALVIIIGFALFEGWGVYQQYENVELVKQEKSAAIKRLEKAQALALAHSPDQNLVRRVKEMEAIYEKRQELQKMLSLHARQDNEGYANVLISLARQIVSGLWLTSITIQQNGEFLEIEGETIHPGLLPQYLQNLSNEPSLKGKEFEVFQMSRQTMTDSGKQAESMAFIMATHQSVESAVD